MWPLFVGAAAMDLIVKHSKKKRRQKNPIPTVKNCISLGLGWHGHLQFYSDIRLESLYEILKDVPRQHYAKICGDLNATHPLLYCRMNNKSMKLTYKNHHNPEIKKFFQKELKKEVSRLKKILVSKGYRFEDSTPKKVKKISNTPLPTGTILPPNYKAGDKLPLVPRRKISKVRRFFRKYIDPYIGTIIKIGIGCVAIAAIGSCLGIPVSFNVNLITPTGALSYEVWKIGGNSRPAPQICDIPDFKKKKTGNTDDTKEQDDSEDKGEPKIKKEKKPTPKGIAYEEIPEAPSVPRIMDKENSNSLPEKDDYVFVSKKSEPDDFPPSGIEEIFEPEPVLVDKPKSEVKFSSSVSPSLSGDGILRREMSYDKSKSEMKFSSSISPSLKGDGILRGTISNDYSSYGVFLKPDMADGRNSLGMFLGQKLPQDKSEPVKIYDLSKTHKSSIKTFDVCRTEFFKEEQIGIVNGRLFTEHRYGVETDLDCINNGLHSLHKMVLGGGLARSTFVLGSELISIGPEIISTLSPVVAASFSVSK